MCIDAPTPAPLRLKTALHARGPAAGLVLDDDQVVAIAGSAKTPPVRVTVNGYTFAGRVGRRGGQALIGFNRAVREACGVQAGDEIEVEIALDTQPREVEVPDALAAALREDDEARAAFAALAYTHRKELARRVAEAKRPETRDRRVGETLAQLRS